MWHTYSTIISEPLALLHNNKVYCTVLSPPYAYCNTVVPGNLALEKKKVMAILATTTTRQKRQMAQCYIVI